MSQITILIGAQWGDEGKGKWVDILSEKADVIARFQGGNNAGHTLYIDGKKLVLHQVPSGVFHPHTAVALSAGVVINPGELVREMSVVRERCKVNPDRFWLSERAHVITPWHIELDCRREKTALSPIGTTKRGIGPTYAEKYARLGLRVGQFVSSSGRKDWLEAMQNHSPEFQTFYNENRKQWDEFWASAAGLSDFVCDAEQRVRQSLFDGKRLLLEGAQGALLDIDHGTYPFVTSSSTMVGGAFASIGFSPRRVESIVGVAKAYTTRVGSGPFPTELNDAAGTHMSTKGHEFGATTGRPRRCGWLDGVALRYVYHANGFDGVILNKIDILSGLDEVKICTAYDHPELGRLTHFPSDSSVLEACKPIYRSLPGWHQPLDGMTRLNQLPKQTREFIQVVEEVIQGKVAMVGTGVNRGDGIICGE